MIRQRGFEQNPKQAPKFWQNILQLGKLIAVHADAKTADISMVSGGAVYRNVPVLCPMGSTSSGMSYLPDPHNPKRNTEEGFDRPEAYGQRDIFAVVGFVEGQGSMPIILGFRYPEKNQLSFSNIVGANQQLERHESDRYHRVTGDTVSKFGGQDVSGEEEIRWPDNSYFKVVKAGGSRALTDLSAKNLDTEEFPFTVKKDERKGFYYQHASGTRVYISPDGELKIGHHTGTWISIAPATTELAAETVAVASVDSLSDPPTAASTAVVQVHVEHSSGTKFTIDASGNISVTCVKSSTETITNTKTITAGDNALVTTPLTEVKSAAVKLGTGTLRQLLDSRTHTYLGDFVTALNLWLNTHTHAGPTPDQTAALASPPTINNAASVQTTAA